MIHILVGGDNETTLNIHAFLQELLQPYDADVVYCTTPNEVLARHTERRADLVLYHFELAALTSFEVYHLIRDSRVGLDVPLFVLEGDAFVNGRPPDAHTHILAEPIRASALAGAVGRIFRLGLAVDADRPLMVENEAGAPPPPPPPGPPDPAEEADTEQEMPVEDTTERRFRELEELTNVKFRRRGDPEPVAAVPAEGDVFYIIPDRVRRRFFYSNELCQRFLDWIEDSAWFQRRGRKRQLAGKSVVTAADENPGLSLADTREFRRLRNLQAGKGDRAVLVVLLVIGLSIIAVGAWMALQIMATVGD